MDAQLNFSCVAHLSLRNTLREMHIRSPSPPRIDKKPLSSKPEKPKKKYGHVYLIPFTFEWHQRKSRIYGNPVIQKPECQYFSYVCDLEKERLMYYDDLTTPERADEDIKIPCEVFDDHLEAEEYYNFLFKRRDKRRYAILRPNIYESSIPKTYPGILPKFMIRKRYPPKIKLTFDVKIYNEINPKNDKKRKVIRTICEARTIPAGRPGQKMGEILVAKYVYIKNIGTYLKKNVPNASEEDSEEGGDYPCSICGGPKGKQFFPETKPIKEKSWIKRPRKKKEKHPFVDLNLSDFAIKEKKKEEVIEDQETLRVREENKKYMEAWQTLLENIEKMEKLKLETEKCVCPNKSKKQTKHYPENDCTCAIWNLPPPEIIPAKISCECDPKLEEVYEPILLKDDKCDCKQKAREEAMKACEKCGKPIENQKDEESNQGVCVCTKILDACGACVKQTPIKFPLMEGEKLKECECKAEPPTEGQEVIVAYVFVDNSPPKEKKSKSDDDCACEQGKTPKSSERTKNKRNLENRTENKSDKIRKENIREESDKNIKPKKKEVECLRTCGKLLALNHCQKETEKLLNLLKCECPKCKDLRRKYRAKYIQTGTRDACGGILPVIGGAFGVEKECDCLQKFEAKVQKVENYKQRMKAKLDLKSHENQYIISGVHQTNKETVYNIERVVPKKSCSCISSEDRLLQKEKQQKLSENVKMGFKHTISGVHEGSKENEFVLGEVIKECECSEVYEKFMEEHNECLVNYEKYLQHMKGEIQAYMEEMRERYKDPPLTGQKLVESEIRRMFGAPGLALPEGKKDFVVSGVQANDFGKSFILGGILLNQKESEECTIAIESYTHLADNGDKSKCQKTYMCNYMTFGKNCGNPFQPIKETNVQRSSEELICQCISYESLESETSSEGEGTQDEEVQEKEEIEVQDGCACECPCGVKIERPDECSCMKISEVSEESCICEEEEQNEDEERSIVTPEGCTCGDVEIKSSGTASDPCLCGVKNCGCQVDEVCVKECFYGPMEAWWSDSDFKEKKNEDEEESEKTEESVHSISPIGGRSKRYVILKRIPKRRKYQDDIIKKLLNGLADDGFPLAKLPECHKIPYFWLWMQFRMKKRWNYDDAIKNYRQTQKLWNHIDICKRTVPAPKFPSDFIHCVCGLSNFTWREKNTLDKMVLQVQQKYYDKLRKNMVEFAREFFVTISPYQYPNPSCLNHYFYAYQPSKPENVIAEYVWQNHEHKDPTKYRSCFCR
ncbi:hypothetical protein HHI36_009418 [Cryptolaemus montrouzieri]|uniref:DUF4771 domain-containing protein n=1 Tax=Cryptolaemus montrouzieri TaxID=559131 RepID=A0ABD2MVA0_9CUCU